VEIKQRNMHAGPPIVQKAQIELLDGPE